MCAFEDRRLVLACLLQPWLRCPASHALVASLVPDATAFVRTACVSALGLPSGTPLPLSPPSSRDPLRPCTLTCGHSPSVGPAGDAAPAPAAGHDGDGDEAVLREGIRHLPFGLMYLGDTSCYAAARVAGGDGATPQEVQALGERGSKRARLHGSAEGEAGGARAAEGRRTGDSGAVATAATDGAAAVAAVAMADPGMHSRHVWWRTAAAALAALFTDPAGPLARPAGRTAACGVQAAATARGGPRRSGSGTARRESSGAGGSLDWVGFGPCCHDVALVLQRILQVAMVRPHTGGHGHCTPGAHVYTRIGDVFLHARFHRAAWCMRRKERVHAHGHVISSSTPLH